LTSLLLIALVSQAATGAADLTERALAARREGRCAEASPLLERALARQPRNATLRKLLADCRMREGRPAEARAELERVLADNPEDGDAQEALRVAFGAMQAPEQERQDKLIDSREAAGARLEIQQQYRRAEELLAAGRRAEAQLALARIVSADPGFVPAALRLAEVYSATKRFDAAARLYLLIYEREPQHDQWLLRAARNLQWAEDAPGAIEAYKAYLARHPGDDEVRLSLADTLRQFGLCDEGLPEYQRLAAARSGDARLHLGIALCQDQLGAADLAIDAFLKVLELEPRNEVALRARQQRERDFDELPRRRAYAAIERGDLGVAAQHLEEFVAKHPASDDGLRELAEVYSWSGRYADAEQRYVEYLARVPEDDIALRALARVQSWGGRLAEARASYEKLIAWGKARTGDYEGLVDVLLWTDQLDAAEPYARRLLELEPGSPGALRALAELSTRQALRAREAAEALESDRRFAEARAAYDAYLRIHGPDPQIELRLCELYSWAGQHAAAAEAYRRFLEKHPAELQARLGLAHSLAWMGEPAAAEPHFQAVLAERPADAGALVGLAQALDAAGRDPFDVLAAYERVLTVEPGNETAKRGLAEVRLRVAPVLSVEERTLVDSDELRASVLEADTRFTLRGAVSLVPFYRLRAYRQTRVLEGDGAAVDAVNQLVADRLGSFTGQGLGLGVQLGSGRLRGFGEVGFIAYGSGQESPTAQAEVRLQLGSRGAAALGWRHDDAITEVNTVVSLAAGVSIDVLQASAERTFGGRVRLWGAGALAWYSTGSTAQLEGAFAANRQDRVSGGVSWLIGPARVGYVFRQSGFERRSPLYFSPAQYRVSALQLAADGAHGSFGWGIDAQAGLADIDGERNDEWAVLVSGGYRLSPRLRLVAAGRLSRSSEGLQATRPYHTRLLQLSLEKVF
jgi:tetratricopeptide (TPR) repeat protein